MKKYAACVEAGDKAAAEVAYKEAVKLVDRAVCRGTVHKNLAARKKSQFTKALNNM
ncbi:MAG: 30S ribosomal protein S20 [Clostridia bacterium]|nr:30S ribosomal protein S20 [Clostridia bacterium]